MLHRDALQAARITELKEQLQVITKRKARKRKRIQKGGTLEFGAGVELSTTRGPSSTPVTKKRCSRGDQAGALLTIRRCGNCGKTRHNTRTCLKEVEESSKSDKSTQYAGSL